MRLRTLLILAGNLIVAVAGCTTVAASGLPPHQIPRTESALTVDGVLDEPA